jgi:hypothetical protein
MSGDAFRRARPGEKLTLPAAAWNACLDAAEAHKRGPGGGRPIEQYRQADIVLCKNTSGSDVARFGVLGIAGVIITPADNLDSFQSQVAVTGTTPTADHRGRFVVCLEPIAAGAIGRAWISGVCQVQVNITDATHTHCDITPSDRDKLKSSGSGARILYRTNAGTGTQWCVVRIGDSGDPIRIGKTTSTWTKGSLATITLYESGTPPNETTGSPTQTLANCVNKFGDVQNDRWVSVARAANGSWYLIAAEC